MLKKMHNYYFKIDLKIRHLMKSGFIFSYTIILLSCLTLFTYKIFYNSPILYYIGLNIFKLGITYFVTFLCFGFAFNRIINEIRNI